MTTADPWADDAPATPAPTDAASIAAAPVAPPADAKPPETPGSTAKTAPAARKSTTPAPAARKTAAPAPAAAASAATVAPVPVRGGLLSASLQDQKTILSVLLYGPEGTGKTTDALRMTKLCVKPNQRVLLVDAEAGAKVRALRQRDIDVSRIIPWPANADGSTDPSRINYDGFEELIAEIRNAREQGIDIIGVVWDSGTEITKRILDDVVAASAEKDRRLGKARGAFQVNLEDHGVASSMLRALLREFRDLGLHLVITALERRDNDPDTGKVKYGPAMSPAMANDVAGLVDIVGYTLVEEVGPDAVEIRSARFVPIERRRAKDRFGLLPGKLADPYFDRIFAYVEGELNRDNDPVQARVRELAGAAPAPAAPTPDAVEGAAAAAAS